MYQASKQAEVRSAKETAAVPVNISSAVQHTFKPEDKEKPLNFDAPLDESFLVEILHLPRSKCTTVMAELTSIGLVNPTKLMQAWWQGLVNEGWLLEKGKIDILDVGDVVKHFGIASDAFQFRNSLRKVLDGLGWMLEGEEEVALLSIFTVSFY